MWPFNKKIPASTNLSAIESNWQLVKTTFRGRPLTARVNQSLVALTGHAKYPIHLGISIPFDSSSANGMPSPAERISLDAIEHIVALEIENKSAFLLAAIYTLANVREMVLYVTDSASAKVLFNAVQENISSHELKMTVEQDREWKAFKQLTGSLKG